MTAKSTQTHKAPCLLSSILDLFILFIYFQEAFYCRHHGRSWTLTCNRSQQRGVVDSNPFAPLQPNNGIFPLWPLTQLFFSLGYDVTTVRGRSWSAESKMRSSLRAAARVETSAACSTTLTERSADSGEWSALSAKMFTAAHGKQDPLPPPCSSNSVDFKRISSHWTRNHLDGSWLYFKIKKKKKRKCIFSRCCIPMMSQGRPAFFRMLGIHNNTPRLQPRFWEMSRGACQLRYPSSALLSGPCFVVTLHRNRGSL